jgi:hypothetical protein
MRQYARAAVPRCRFIAALRTAVACTMGNVGLAAGWDTIDVWPATLRGQSTCKRLH